MRNLLIIFIFIFSPLKASEVSEWFERESTQFLEIINNNEGTESENYEKYKIFISKNFATKSIAYGLIGENIINKSTEDERLGVPKCGLHYNSPSHSRLRLN